ncbi:MAG: tRNA (5-methylaminomethyl-2-thiouridine)(34)-methyltransferase MnmD [Reichenbachiella sp.]|uniref:tRNA (5-methylaminomethyl-2-thiouridine)(34)-methyltransferase MnmD n=1 Tax=Reichenbachiella sp. TaxID=2184521 RepID=UPI0032648729
MPEIKLIETGDGSSSLLIPEMNETYHSTHGAVTESEYVFLKMGLEYFRQVNPGKGDVRIFEVGFGTGLNVWLTALASEENEYSIDYASLEKFPLRPQLVEQLNYGKLKKDSRSNKLFEMIHQAGWEKRTRVTDNFSLTKIEADIVDVDLPEKSFDIIYFDAFAPSRQPEMWSREVLTKMHTLLDVGGIFVTYCAQGQFKRDLKEAGFVTEELDGPPGKKEMTRGTKEL